MTFGITLAEHLTMAASANIFYFAIDYENEPSMILFIYIYLLTLF